MRLAALCGLGLLTVATPSLAADFPILRGSAGPVLGPAAYCPWDGFYVGGQGGYVAAGTNFSYGTSDLTANILRFTTIETEAQVSQWTRLGRADSTGTSYGGFVGYNAQFDDAVVGLELNYSHTDVLVNSADAIGRQYQASDGYLYNVRVNGAASVLLTDYASLRLRGGWAASSFMPYAFIGAAAARADVNRNSTVTLTAVDVSGAFPPRPTVYFGPVTGSDNRPAMFAYGYTVGAGVDWAVLPHVFVRGEFEYAHFGDFNNMIVSVGTLRAGVGAKF